MTEPLAHECPSCGGTDVTYALFSGGREMFCRACDDNYPIPENAADQPRAVLLRTEAGRAALRAQMNAEQDRLRALVKELDGLLACYRTGTNPGARLDRIGKLRRSLDSLPAPRWRR